MVSITSGGKGNDNLPEATIGGGYEWMVVATGPEGGHWNPQAHADNAVPNGGTLGDRGAYTPPPPTSYSMLINRGDEFFRRPSDPPARGLNVTNGASTVGVANVIHSEFTLVFGACRS